MERMLGFWRKQKERESEGLDEQVSAWYRRQFPTSENGDAIPVSLTFADLSAHMEAREAGVSYTSLPSVLKTTDPSVCERVLDEIAYRTGRDRASVYALWRN